MHVKRRHRSTRRPPLRAALRARARRRLPPPIETMSAPAFRALVAERLRALERDVAELRDAHQRPALRRRRRRRHAGRPAAGGVAMVAEPGERGRRRGAPRTLAAARSRPYQREAGRAIAASVHGGLGRTITVEIARQGGKNELSAQIELLLLGRSRRSRRRRREVRADVRAAAAAQHACASGRSIEQADLATARPQRGRRHHVRPRPHRSSSRPSPSPTSSATPPRLLLEVDEAQDVDSEKFDREFRPMAADHQRHDRPLRHRLGRPHAARAREAGEPRSRAPRRRPPPLPVRLAGRRRATSPPTPTFVEGERQRLGDTHPLFLTQYCLKPIAGGGRLFTAAQRAQLAGTHQRLSHPAAATATSPASTSPAPTHPDRRRSRNGRIHDSTRGEGSPKAGVRCPRQHGPDHRPPRPPRTRRRPGARVEIVEHYAWTGEPHETLLPRLIDLLRDVWRVLRVAVDATGLGETTARLIAAALGDARVDQVKFTRRARSRSSASTCSPPSTAAASRLYAATARPSTASSSARRSSPASTIAPTAR